MVNLEKRRNFNHRCILHGFKEREKDAALTPCGISFERELKYNF